jgi:hypothetical protein
MGGIREADAFEKHVRVIVSITHVTGKSEVTPGSVSLVEASCLGEHARLRPDGPRLLFGIVSQHTNRTTRPSDEIEEDVDSRRLARTVRPEKTEHFSILNAEVEIVDGAEGTVLLRQGLCFDGGHAGEL